MPFNDASKQALTEELENKWSDLLDHKAFDPIEGSYRRQVTAILLENQQVALQESTAHAQDVGTVQNWDPILMSLVRRSAPNLIAYDVCGVQPMTGPTGLVFALRAAYGDNSSTVQSAINNEALFNEASTSFGGTGGQGAGATSDGGSDFSTRASTGGITIGRPFPTSEGEQLGVAGGTPFQQMTFNIDKISVTAKTRGLKAEFTTELQQDLKAIHGLDAETELSNILSNEILAEINREIIRTIYHVAKTGAQTGTSVPGQFNLDTDSNGRWSVERFKGLLFQLERECNVIAQESRRGKGNFVITSSDVAAALSMAGVLDYAPALQTNLNVDDTGNTFAGVVNGKLKVYVDPYFASDATDEYFCTGYKGASPMDSGLFYCPYVPLQMMRAIGEDTFQPKIGFKTRYGLVSNPFVVTSGSPDAEALTYNTNQYFRFVTVKNLM